MTVEQLANFCENQLAEKLKFFNNSEVVRFTPSVNGSRRYMGFKQDGKEFAIEIKIEEV